MEIIFDSGSAPLFSVINRLLDRRFRISFPNFHKYDPLSPGEIFDSGSKLVKFLFFRMKFSETGCVEEEA